MIASAGGEPWPSVQISKGLEKKRGFHKVEDREKEKDNASAATVVGERWWWCLVLRDRQKKEKMCSGVD